MEPQGIPEQPSCFVNLIHHDGEEVSGDVLGEKYAVAGNLVKAGPGGMLLIPFADGRVSLTSWGNTKRCDLYDEDPINREFELLRAEQIKLENEALVVVPN